MKVEKVGQALFVSEQALRQYHVVHRSRQEQEQHEADVAKFQAFIDSVQPGMHEVIRTLDAVTLPFVREVLDLHQRVSDGGRRWRCHGCEVDGWEAEQPEYPCATTRLIADLMDIEFFEPSLLERPMDGSLDAPI